VPKRLSREGRRVPTIEIALRLVTGVLLILAYGFFVAIEFALTRVRQYSSSSIFSGTRPLQGSRLDRRAVYLPFMQHLFLLRDSNQSQLLHDLKSDLCFVLEVRCRLNRSPNLCLDVFLRLGSRGSTITQSP